MANMPKNPTRLYKKNLSNLQSYKPSSGATERQTHVGHGQQIANIAQQTKATPVTRNRSSAKSAGTRTERAVADYLAQQLDTDIDRRVKTGAKDRGDIAGLKHWGNRLVVEVKDCARTDLPAWTTQAHIEASNDDALMGFVVAKRRGTTNPGQFWVHMTLDDLLALLSGERHGHRKDIA